MFTQGLNTCKTSGIFLPKSQMDPQQQLPTPPASDEGSDSTAKKLKRKMSHSAIERRRRDRINACFDHLKNIIPSCASHPDGWQKLTVLEKTIEYIHELRAKLGVPETTAQFNPSTIQFRPIQFQPTVTPLMEGYIHGSQGNRYDSDSTGETCIRRDSSSSSDSRHRRRASMESIGSIGSIDSVGSIGSVGSVASAGSMGSIKMKLANLLS